MNEVLSWFGSSFQNIKHIIMFWSLELAIEQYWWHLKCVTNDSVLTNLPHPHRDFHIFSANLRLILAKCYVSDPWLFCFEPWWDNLLHARHITDWFSAIIIFHVLDSMSVDFSTIKEVFLVAKLACLQITGESVKTDNYLSIIW